MFLGRSIHTIRLLAAQNAAYPRKYKSLSDDISGKTPAFFNNILQRYCFLMHQIFVYQILSNTLDKFMEYQTTHNCCCSELMVSNCCQLLCELLISSTNVFISRHWDLVRFFYSLNCGKKILVWMMEMRWKQSPKFYCLHLKSMNRNRMIKKIVGKFQPVIQCLLFFE